MVSTPFGLKTPPKAYTVAQTEAQHHLDSSILGKGIALDLATTAWQPKNSTLPRGTLCFNESPATTKSDCPNIRIAQTYRTRQKSPTIDYKGLFGAVPFGVGRENKEVKIPMLCKPQLGFLCYTMLLDDTPD